MPFLDSLDIANRACQHCGVAQIASPTEDSLRCTEITMVYDKVRRAELRRNIWRFATRRAVLRAISATTLTLVPGTYSSNNTYLPGEIVQDANFLYWVSQRADNSNNTPGGNNDAWDMFFGPKTVDVFDATTTYSAGELCYVLTGTTPNGYQVYMSLINNNSDVPNTATAYSATVQYKQDDVVSSGGSQWRSLLPINKANTPAVPPLAYSASTTYTTSNTVTGSDNYIYSSVGSGNIGNDPTTDGGVHWTNTGVLSAWSKSPTIVASSMNWRPIVATLKNAVPIYPIGTGPSSQNTTRNLFRLPVGFLREAPQDPKAGSTSALGAPSGLAYGDWLYEGNHIVTQDVGPIVLRFVADVTKVTDMDDMFCEGLACRIAAEVCVRLTQSDAKLQTIASAYKEFMGSARLVNGIETGSVEPPVDDWLQCRA